MNSIVKIFEEDNDDASIFLYQPNILSNNKYSQLKDWVGQLNYKNGATKNGSIINRQQVWYQQDQKYFCPVWKQRHSRWESEPYDKLLHECQNDIQNIIDGICEEYDCLIEPKINSCLVNKYSNGTEFIPPHRDSKISFGEQPTIVGLSLGGTRTLQFNRVINEGIPYSKHTIVKTFEQPLQDNSLFIMGGCSQKYFTHQIPKDDSTDIRYSLTFREMVI
jgi:alkylated DNA repair dioxygenase AlkB